MVPPWAPPLRLRTAPASGPIGRTGRRLVEDEAGPASARQGLHPCHELAPIWVGLGLVRTRLAGCGERSSTSVSREAAMTARHPRRLQLGRRSRVAGAMRIALPLSAGHTARSRAELPGLASARLHRRHE